VELLDWLREQRKYGQIEAMMVQIRRDIEQTVERAGLSPAAEIARI